MRPTVFLKWLLIALSGGAVSNFVFAQSMSYTVWNRPKSEPIANPKLYYRPIKDPHFGSIEITNAATGWESSSAFTVVEVRVTTPPGSLLSKEELDQQKQALFRANQLTITYYSRSRYEYDTFAPLSWKATGDSLLMTLPNEDAPLDGFIEVNAFEESNGAWVWLASGRTALDSASPGLLRQRSGNFQLAQGIAILEDGSKVPTENFIPVAPIKALRLIGTGILGSRCDRRASAALLVKTEDRVLQIRNLKIEDLPESEHLFPGFQAIDIEFDGTLQVPPEKYLRLSLKIEGCGELAPYSPKSLQTSNEVDLVFEGALEKAIDTKPPSNPAHGFSTEGQIPRSPSQNISAVAPLARNLESWELRKKALRRQFLKATRLDPAPEKTNLLPILHTSRQRDGYRIQNVNFESTPGFLVTGNLYLPMGRIGARPAILLTHGHFENEASKQGGFSPRTMKETQILAARLAQAGAVVFAYDMVGYGDAQQVKHSVKNALQLQTWNSVRAIDFLETLSDDFGGPLVDKTRIGMTGASGGATQGLYAQMIDDRISAFAPVVMIAAGYRGGGEVCEEGMPIHDIPGQPRTNNTELSSMMAPKPTLFVSNGADWTQWFHNEEFSYVQHVYGLYSAQNQTHSKNFPHEGHDYGPNKRQAAYDFFEKVFGLDFSDVRSPKDSDNPEGIDIQRNSALRATSIFKGRSARPIQLLK